MDENNFKKINRPASCTQPVWASVIPKAQRDDVLRQIRQESIQHYGHSLDECPKRLTCFGKECIGRPLPTLSQAAKPYIDRLKAIHNVVGDELFINNCGGCPIANKCTSACAQVNDFMQRDKAREPNLEYREHIENIADQVQQETAPTYHFFANELAIPWDAINEKRKNTIKKYLYEQKDFLTVAKEVGYHDQSRARYEYYAGLTTLAEFSTMRKFIEDQSHELNEKIREVLIEVYVKNQTITEVAKNKNVTKQAVQQMISRVVSKYKLKWPVFVKKEGNKVIYNKTEVLR